MPELPDITIYLEALEQRILGQELAGVRIGSPFILRTFDPPLEAVGGKTVRELRRIGKRIAIGLEGDTLARAALDDRGAPALEAARRPTGRQK